MAAGPLLLDTHTVLWFLEGNAQLPAHLRRLLETSTERTFVSIASWWEIGIKHSIGKLELLAPLAETRQNATQGGCAELPITFKHILTVSRFPFHHRDPFDRLLIAQALFYGLTLVSRDPKFDAYGVRRIW